jgi:hypothetical protein
MNELEKQYLNILVSIAKDRNLIKLARYIEDYDKNKVTSQVEEIKDTVKEEVKPIIKPKYNITHLPEAVCDGCEG